MPLHHQARRGLVIPQRPRTAAGETQLQVRVLNPAVLTLGSAHTYTDPMPAAGQQT